MGMTLDSGGGKSKRHRAQPEMNVTPLVDVALVVLIIFMVVTPLATLTFWLNIPKKPENQAQAAPQDSKPLVMTVDADGTIRLNKEVVSKQALPERLPRMLAAQKGKPMHFDAAAGTPYGTAVDALDRARVAGATTIAIATQELKH